MIVFLFLFHPTIGCIVVQVAFLANEVKCLPMGCSACSAHPTSRLSTWHYLSSGRHVPERVLWALAGVAAWL